MAKKIAAQHEEENVLQSIVSLVQSAIGKRKPAVAKTPAWFSLTNSAQTADFVIDGPIGKSWYDPDGTASKEFNAALATVPKGRPISVKIHSDGGSVGDGLAIYNALQERKDDVTCIVSGFACSIASIIALGGSTLIAPKSSVLMIHDPLCQTVGNKAEHEGSVEMLDTMADTMAGIYAAKTGKTKTEMREAMAKTTWFSGEEAVAFGLADSSPEDAEADEASARALAKLDLSQFQNVPQSVQSLVAAAGLAHSPAKEISESSGHVAAESNNIKNPMTSNDKPAATAAVPVAAATATATPTATIDPAAFAEMQAALNREKKARIEARVDSHIAEARLTNEEREDAVTRSIADEGYLGVIAKRPQVRPGGVPIAHGASIEVLGTVAEQIKSTKDVSARHSMRRHHWAGLFQQANQRDDAQAQRTGAVAANTYSSTLIVDFLQDGVVTNLISKLASLRAFTRVFTNNPIVPLSTVQVRNVTATSATVVGNKANGGISNYEQGNGTVGAISVAMNEMHQGFGVSGFDLQTGLQLENLVQFNLGTFAKTILTYALAPLATSIFTGGSAANGTILTRAGTFGWDKQRNIGFTSPGSDMTDLRAALGRSPVKNAILDPITFSKLINGPYMFQNPGNTDGSFAAVGWDRIAEASDCFPRTDIVGFAAGANAIVAASGLPAEAPKVSGNTLISNTVTIPELELTIAIYHWFALASRTAWASFDVMFGAAAGDLTAGAVLRNLG